jgi:acyl-CoA hydrolase
MYKHKIKTVEEALDLVKSGDVIISGLAASEGRLFFTKLHSIADKVKDVTIVNCLPMSDARYFIDEAYANSFNVDGFFFTNVLRKSKKNGNISFIPNHLHLSGRKRFEYQRPTVFVGNATYPDKHGYVSLSLSNVYEQTAIAMADTVIIEVNKNLPRTFGDVELHINDIDVIIESDYEIPTLPNVESNPRDLKIGGYIADYIQDGDCIQLGIGGIPNGVAASLMNKKDIGIHTEMFTSGMMDLIKAGVVTNKCKQTHVKKSVCAFVLGSKELYEFVDDNPSILVMDGNYVNDPYVIGLNDNQISINTSIEVDLTGQCASESIGHVQFSGTGGQADTAIGAQRSKNGKSFIALYSTANVLNKETGNKEPISKIVVSLKPGAAVSLSRNDVDYVVTEYGVAPLRGTSIKDRVELLIGIAHPDFREQLKKEAKKVGLIE